MAISTGEEPEALSCDWIFYPHSSIAVIDQRRVTISADPKNIVLVGRLVCPQGHAPIQPDMRDGFKRPFIRRYIDLQSKQ